MRIPAIALLTVLSFLPFRSARADTFSFTVAFPYSTAYGTLTGNLDPRYPGEGVWDVTGGSGEMNGSAMTLIPVSTPGVTETQIFNGTAFSYNDTFRGTLPPGGGSYIADGFDFVFSWEGEYILFSGSLRNFAYDSNPSYGDAGRVFWTVADAGVLQDPTAVTPEPSSLALLGTGTGLLAVVGSMRRRRGLQPIS